MCLQILLPNYSFTHMKLGLCLEKNMKNDIICDGRRNPRPSKMCHSPLPFFELLVTYFGAYHVFLFMFFLKNVILLESDFSSTIQTAVAFTTQQVPCWMSIEHSVSCWILLVCPI